MDEQALRRDVAELYPPEQVADVVERLLALVRRHRRPRALRPLDERDVWLITYADSVADGVRPPLRVLADVLDGPLAPVVSGVHVLPLHPSSSDDGFAPVDPTAVDPALGSWADVAALGRGRRMVLDLVANHVSASSAHVRDWTGHVLEVADDVDTSRVVRPRTSPLRTDVHDGRGRRHRVWTTFSADQVDLDYRNPDVLLDVTGQLLGLLDRGADGVRLDAVGFLWKEPGTSCLHLPQVHAIVRIWRAVVDACAPGAILLAEANVPHEENVAYLGRGDDEARMVYQFTLAPLLLAALRWGNAQDLVAWAASLPVARGSGTYLNVLATHDGIGLRPAEARMPATQVEGLAALAVRAGGSVSHRTGPDGFDVPYELNCTLLDLCDAMADDGLGLARMLAAHAVLLAVQGVPALWVGALLALDNDVEAVRASGVARRINRRRLTTSSLAALLVPGTRTAAHVAGLAELVALRRTSPAFAPTSPQRVLPAPPWLVAVERGADDGREVVLVSVAARDTAVDPAGLVGEGTWRDRREGSSGRPYRRGDRMVLPPYGVAWLTPA